MPDVETVELGELGDRRDQLGSRARPRIGGEHALRVGQHHQQLGAEQDRHLRREEVVVAEGDLVGRGRVVLVDHRDHAPLEQLAQRLARVQVVGPGADVEERQQHLGGRHAARAQQLVVDLVELALADRAGGLQLVDGARPHRERHHPHPAGDRAAGDDDQLAAGVVQLGELVADPAEHVGAHLAAAVGDDARAQLDDEGAHARKVRTPAAAPGSRPCDQPMLSSPGPVPAGPAVPYTTGWPARPCTGWASSPGAWAACA